MEVSAVGGQAKPVALNATGVSPQQFTNHSKKVIKLSNPEVSCGCVSFILKENEIKSFGSINIKVIYDSEGGDGDFKRSIMVDYSSLS